VIIGIISDEIATKVRVARFPNPGTLFAHTRLTFLFTIAVTCPRNTARR
jgi:hypothetical protein